MLNTIEELRFSGHGGSIFKKDSLVNSINNTYIIDKLSENWINYFGLEP
jgi:hypothetical protein